MDKLMYLDKLSFSLSGSEDTEGYQVFTPKFIVKEMVNKIGPEITNFDKTILEPTSGDGAFTCYILHKRLECVTDVNPGVESLKALSTIYSIEMDKKLLQNQRNKIYTMMVDFARANNIKDKKYFETVETIILNNFIWGCTNYESPIDLNGILEPVIAYKMPVDESKSKLVDFYSWIINDDYSYAKKREVIE